MTPPNTPTHTRWAGPRFFTPRGHTQHLDSNTQGLLSPTPTSQTQTQTLPPGFAFPGFIDTHTHLGAFNLRPGDLDLTPTQTLSQIAEIVATAALARPLGDWISGRGWAAPDETPTHHTLSAAAPKHPVSLRRTDEHALLANAAAMQLAKITPQTPNPPGGHIVRDPQGQPTGLFLDNAMFLITQHIPPPSQADRETLILQECTLFLSHGITCIHEMATTPELLSTLTSLERRNLLPLRVRAYLHAANPATQAHITAGPDPIGPHKLRKCGLKLFADGALGSQGARLSCAYHNNTHGVQPDPNTLLQKTLAQSRKHTWQLAIHAIGDLAVKQSIALLSPSAHNTQNAQNNAQNTPQTTLPTAEPTAEPTAGPTVRPTTLPAALNNRRWRIEHAQIISNEDVEAMAAAKLCAAMQPIHATHDLPWAAPILGPTLTAHSYRWKTLLQANIPLGFGSDHPIESPSVTAGLLAATQRSADSTPLPGQEERLTRLEALHAYWRGAAYLSFDEDWLGALSPGFCCDFAVWNTDLLTCSPKELERAQCLAVIVAGKKVWERTS